MSNTPETDAFQQTDQCAYDSMWRGFARKLERERDEAVQSRKASAADWLNQIANADLRVTRIKRERDLWKAEAERWKGIKK